MKKLYTVLLKKNLNNISHINSCNKERKNFTHWLALGHFDDIYTYYMDVGFNLLDMIRKDKNDILEENREEAYYYPIYLLPSEQNYTPILPHWFIAIVRIHFKYSLGIQNQFNQLVTCLKETTCDNVDTSVYYATEFSDVVLEVQSDRIDSLLNYVLNFQKNDINCIGKMYTYFGINQQKDFSLNVLEDDLVPLLCMRFSGYKLDTIKKQINLIEKHLGKTTTYIVNGIDDLSLHYNNVKAKKLISLYREWLLDGVYQSIRQSESSTKFGIEFEFGTFNDRDTLENTLPNEYHLCDALPDLCREIDRYLKTKSKPYQFGWFHTISEISYSLVRMSKTPIMDEVVYLVAPGVRVFLNHVLNCIKTDSLIDEEVLYDYARNCSHFIEQLMRMEGQLSHNPEIRPVIYTTPIFMIEYTLAFLNSVSNILMNDDPEDVKKDTVIFLVPCPCERTSAVEIFSAKEGIPGLVHIQIPESILATPQEAFRALCHEISHYVGEKWRNRSKRRQAYAHSIASLLGECIFENSHEWFIRTWKEKIMKTLMICNVDTIQQMHEETIYELSLILNNKKSNIDKYNDFDDIVKRYFERCRENNTLPTRMPLLPRETISDLFDNSFLPAVGTIDKLFREIYADICMIYILNIDNDVYIRSLLEELERISCKNLSPENEWYTYEVFAVRIWITLHSLGRAIYYKSKDYSKIWEEIQKLISNISRVEVGETINDIIMNSNVIYALLQYAKECCLTIKSNLDETAFVKIREKYNMFSSNNSYNDILSEIESYRNKYV